jgi:hypothetical protein
MAKNQLVQIEKKKELKGEPRSKLRIQFASKRAQIGS